MLLETQAEVKPRMGAAVAARKTRIDRYASGLGQSA